VVCLAFWWKMFAWHFGGRALLGDWSAQFGELCVADAGFALLGASFAWRLVSFVFSARDLWDKATNGVGLSHTAVAVVTANGRKMPLSASCIRKKGVFCVKSLK